MACYHPISAWRSKDGKNANGSWPLVFKKDEGNPLFPVVIPCGRCIGCRLKRSSEWALRCIQEASLHNYNCFITLTYNDEHLEKRCGILNVDNGEIEGYSLNRRDFVLFMKRLRKKYSDRIRFFHCGEYGEKFSRPHHHACLFGIEFPDRVQISNKKGIRLYTSEILNSLWGHGYCIIGDVTFDSAAYVARYITKKITGEKALEHYDGREPEYITMSRKPGIGKEFFEKYQNDIMSQDAIILRGGLKLRSPKYYDKLYDVKNHDRMEEIKRKRRRDAIENKKSIERLETLEKIKRIKLKQSLQRIYENGSSHICS